MRNFIYLCLCINIFIMLIFFLNIHSHVPNLSKRTFWSKYFTITSDDKGNPYAQCVFPNYNPYGKETKKNIDLWLDEEANCPKQFINTKLENKKIYPLDDKAYCFGRCITRHSDWENKYGEWVPVENTTFECDFVEAGCSSRNDVNTLRFNETDLHMQINKIEQTKKSAKNKYNVYIFYMTADDWAMHLLGWPDCVGTKKQVPHHTLQPYMRELKSGKYSEERKERICEPRDTRLVFNYTQKFIDAYPDDPQFIFSVVTQISHSSQKGSVQIDTDFYDFLWRNQKTMENSFVIWMSDHGLRFGDGVGTALGQYELSNPMLYISVPKELRETGILEMMKENAKKLQTHWDTRATLLDILKYQPQSNFTARHSMQIPGERGNSYFRKQTGERTCRTLPISFEYCTCVYEIETLDPKSEEAETAGKAVISHINNLFVTRNVTRECPPWTFGRVIEISAYSPKDVTNSFKIQVAPSEPYDKAVFTTIVIKKDNHYSVGSVDRLDSYGTRGDCQKTDLQQLCDCRTQ